MVMVMIVSNVQNADIILYWRNGPCIRNRKNGGKQGMIP